MSIALKGAIFALGIAGAFAIAGPASAADAGIGVHIGGIGVGVGVGLGDVAYGYRDGYWDNDHRWHNWRDAREMNEYRNRSGNHYYDYRHDRDPDQGWR